MDIPGAILDTIVNILFVPLQLVLLPIDALLAQIPGITVIPQSINYIVSFIGTIPETIVALFGISPFLWNAQFLLFIIYIGVLPLINGVKKIWEWVRP